MAEKCKGEVLLAASKPVTPDELQLLVCMFRCVTVQGLAYLRKCQSAG
jgi:hypothetical protein